MQFTGDCTNVWEILYADDTMVMGNRAREINIILKQIEIESEKYNLKLNHSKCFYVGMNGTANIHFKDGTRIEKADQVTYLGGTITSDSSRSKEINNRMRIALITCQKLKLFWRKTSASITWKLQVYNAIIIAQLVYGLNTLNITPGIKKRLDAFHMRGLRYILNIEHSFYSHTTNKEVLDKVNLLINEVDPLEITWEQFKVDKATQNEDYKATKLVGDLILERQLTLLGHVLRRDQSNLMRKVTCDEQLRRPYQLYKKTGHPRTNWTDDNILRAHNLHGKNSEIFDKDNQTHILAIKKAAKDYKF
jgi:hypothetical protein